MIVVDVNSRLTMQEVCEHQWFKKMSSLSGVNLNSPMRKEAIKEMWDEDDALLPAVTNGGKKSNKKNGAHKGGEDMEVV